MRKLLISALLIAACGAPAERRAHDTYVVEVQNNSWDILTVVAFCGDSRRGVIRQVPALATVRKAVDLAGCGHIWFEIQPLAGRPFRTYVQPLSSEYRLIQLRIENTESLSSIVPRGA
jgi:hypothetical protein